ncbi:hypothetical protein OKW21_001953 [Catalinimonas alkaloidigena]|uniref:hypothetical protein n=1 Tax=Catalinimonas alkaloidigena TaxID=1075417 RepID=UPI00240631D5|nr:hypothetical protein [Catalinimonas alkaloidigena]MDF9796690.1 hypothetical protein [Catalinimonas alkaloidigena]
MNTILITPRNVAELNLLMEVIQKMEIESCILSEEEKEDITTALMMREAEREEGMAITEKLQMK